VLHFPIGPVLLLEEKHLRCLLHAGQIAITERTIRLLNIIGIEPKGTIALAIVMRLQL
jgi:hypothetical protein